MAPFHGWLAELGDPFADAWLAVAPDLTTVAGDEIFEPDGAAAARVRELAPEAVTRFEAAQSEALEALAATVSGVDPAPLLCGVILLTQIESWGSHFEPTSVPTALDLELVSSIVASSAYDARRPATADDLMAVMQAARQVRHWAHAVGLAHSWAGPDDTPSRVRSDLLTRWLTWRGGAYPVHAVAAAEALASGRDHNMQARLGFGIGDLTMFVDALRVKRERLLTPALDEAWESACAATGENPDEDIAGSEEFQRQWLAAAMRLSPAALAVPLDGELHLLPPDRGPAESAILKSLGLSPGTAQRVRSVLVDPPHRHKPFALLPPQLGADGEEVGAALALPVNFAALSTDLHLMVEALLARTFQNWPSARARAVDNHAVGLIQRALPNSVAATNVFMEGPGGLEEVDGVVVFEDIVIVVEGKGAPLKIAALRGSVDKFVGQMRDLVSDGSRQLDRDRLHVLSGAPAKFFNASGRCVLEIDGSRVRRCYQVMPCLDGLGDVGTAMPRLRELGVLEESMNPWIVGLTDLHVVVDVLAKPAELVGYLDFRDRWTREPRLVIPDELELLALFLHQVDLAGKLARLAEGGQAHAAPGQSVLDAWYDGMAGYGPVVDRPRIRSTKRFRRFVDEVQRTKPAGWLASAAAALQVPLAVGRALDVSEGTLARNARVGGGLITGDLEFRYVVADEQQQYPALSDDMISPNGTHVLFLRRRRNRLTLEGVQIVTSATRP